MPRMNGRYDWSRSTVRHASVHVSSVSTSVVKPAAFARDRMLIVTSLSLGQYSWYHRGPSPLDSATSSIVCDEAVERTIGTPSAAAARAVASSPSGWTIDCTPTGASSTGAGMLGAEHRRGEVALRGVGQHPRHDPPAVERLPVRPHRRTRPGATGHVPEGPGVEPLPRGILQPGAVRGEHRHLVAEALQVDLVLVRTQLTSHLPLPTASGRIQAVRLAIRSGPILPEPRPRESATHRRPVPYPPC